LFSVKDFLEWSHSCLLQSEEAQDYLITRGVSKEQWSRHSLGFVAGDFAPSPDDPDHNDDCGDKEKRSRWCGTCKYNRWSGQYEEPEEGRKIWRVGRRIQNSIVFPLSTYSGSVIGFQVRSIVEKSYDTYVIPKRPECYFFGIAPNISKIWATKEIWIVEGPLDQLLFERLVISNVVALTTSALNKQQMKFLLRFVERVNFCLDLDGAGRKGFHKFLEHNNTNRFDIRDIKYPKRDNDKDPGDFWKRVGDKKFSEHFNRYL
jgi:DNA primase